MKSDFIIDGLQYTLNHIFYKGINALKMPTSNQEMHQKFKI